MFCGILATGVSTRTVNSIHLYNCLLAQLSKYCLFIKNLKKKTFTGSGHKYSVNHMTATMYYGIHESKHWFGRYLLGTLWAPSLYPNGPTVTGSQSITGPLGCGGMKDSHHRHAAN